MVLLRYAVRVNGLTSLAITKLDVLDGCPELKIAVAYKYRGKTFREMPADLDVLQHAKPVYERHQGWPTSTTKVSNYTALPREAKRYLSRIEELAGCPVDIISTGSRREQTMILNNPMIHTPSRTK